MRSWNNWARVVVPSCYEENRVPRLAWLNTMRVDGMSDRDPIAINHYDGVSFEDACRSRLTMSRGSASDVPR